MLIRNLGALLIGAALAFPSAADAARYNVDAAHTSVGFSIRHLFTATEGRFDRFEGTIEFDIAQPEKTAVRGTIDVSSINTNNAKRDKHLLADDFFAVEAHPKITFESEKVSDISSDGKKASLHGKLTIRGITKPVVLAVEFLGEGADPWGNQKAGFAASGKIDRKDFGIDYNAPLESGGLLLGDEVTIRIQVEAAVPR